MCSSFFFFNDTATTEIYPLSLHDALPISEIRLEQDALGLAPLARAAPEHARQPLPQGHQGKPSRRRHAHSAAKDRKSTRLNSSHSQISYAVFCLKKKKRDNNDSAELVNQT